MHVFFLIDWGRLLNSREKLKPENKCARWREHIRTGRRVGLVCQVNRVILVWRQGDLLPVRRRRQHLGVTSKVVVLFVTLD
jgi:hypothetical protein